MNSTAPASDRAAAAGMPVSLKPVAAGTLVACLAALACLLTYRDWVDGPRDALLFAVGMGLLGALGAMAALVLWGVGVSRSAWAMGLVGLAALSPTVVVHGTRLLYRHALVQSEVVTAAAYRRLAEPVLQGGATADVRGDTLTLTVPVRGAAYLDVRVPGDDQVAWYLPRALLRSLGVTSIGSQVAERLDWRAAVTRNATYLTLVDSDRTQVNVAEWGLLISRPSPSGSIGSDDVSLPQENGAWHDWSLVRGGGRRALMMDGRTVWTGADPGMFQVLRVGETRPDPEHSGALQLQRLRYQRSASSANNVVGTAP